MEKIIVIGGGLMGSSAAWQLSQYGEKVLLIEQQGPIYTNGSSYGESRISRSLGPENDIFSFIHNKAVSEAKRLISFLNTTEKGDFHSMEDLYVTNPVTYIFDETGTEEIKALCHPKQNDYYKVASGKKISEVFGMNIPDSNTVIREYRDYTGMIKPKVLISKLHKGIKHYNNEILFSQTIISITQKETFYEIETIDSNTQNRKTFQTEKLIIAAGPYTGELLAKIAPSFEKLISPVRVFSAFFKFRTATYKTFSDKQKETIRLSVPLFYQYGNMFYAMIDSTDVDGCPIFKTGGHALYNSIENMDACWGIKPTVENVEWSGEELYQYLKALNIPLEKEDIEYVHGQSCVYSLTESKIPVVTAFKNKIKNSLIVIGGMNGVGAKGSLCYGLIAANTLLNKEEDDLMYIKTRDALKGC
jgi:glycine/D-amino acid oxidase-like deaminating enzyme